MTRRLLLFVSAALAGVASVPAQESRGMFAGMPAATSLEATAGLGYLPDQVYVKRPGFHTSAPKTWGALGVPAGRPNFDLAAYFRKQCRLRVALEVDALSIGEDWVIAEPCTGRAKLPPNRWAVVTFSVTRATKGKAGSTIRSEVLRPDGAAADVFSWMLPGSVVPPALVATTHRAQDSREFDLGGGRIRRNVDALDHYVPLYTLESRIANPAPSGMMPGVPVVFFSLSARSARLAPAAWFGKDGPSGATILMIMWNAKTRSWTCPPRVFRSWRRIGLGQKEDIDALAIDLSLRRMLFSTDIRIVKRNPILFQNLAGGCEADPILTYTDPNSGNPVSEEIGLIGLDDVDAICSMDPSVRRRQDPRGARQNAIFFTIGLARTPLGVFPPHFLNASSFRDRDTGSGAVTIRSFMVGWPQNAGPAAGKAVAFLTPPTSILPAVVLSGVQTRNLAAPFAGDPREAKLVVPPALSLTAQTVMLRWFALDSVNLTLAEAYPILVTL